VTALSGIDSTHEKTWLFVWGNVNRVGGTESRMAASTKILVAQGYRVVSFVHTSSKDSAFLDLLTASGAQVVVSTSWRDLPSLIAREKPRAVWSFGLKGSLATRASRLVTGRSATYLMARNGLDFGWKKWMFRVDVLTAGGVDAFITNSRSVKDHLVKTGQDVRKIHHIPSGIASVWSETSPTTIVSSDVLMVGNNRPEKNQLLGVAAFLASTSKGSLTVFTDDGSEITAHLEALPKAQRERVRLVEGVALSPNDYDRFGVLLHPSISESLPLAVMEAMSRGCLVVAGNTGDLERIVEEERGELVNASSAAAVAEALSRAQARIDARDFTRPVSTFPSADDYVFAIQRAVTDLRYRGDAC
jgi:glycosyltransferase involved in cell wall biosynthesis